LRRQTASNLKLKRKIGYSTMGKVHCKEREAVGIFSFASSVMLSKGGMVLGEKRGAMSRSATLKCSVFKKYLKKGGGLH